MLILHNDFHCFCSMSRREPAGGRLIFSLVGFAALRQERAPPVNRALEVAPLGAAEPELPWAERGRAHGWWDVAFG